jgi:Holliday junction resolvase RusA-like endonuclease
MSSMTDTLFQTTDTGVNTAPQRAVKDGHDADLCPPAAPAPVSALVITVYGRPAMQGSKRHVGRGVMIESSKRTRPWRENVRNATRAEIDATGWRRLDSPVSVIVELFFDRPRSHYRTGRNAHLLRDNAPTRPANRASGDIDKMLRAIFDAVCDAGAITDDAQVIAVEAYKHWTGETPGLLPVAGARIEIRQAGR